MKKTFLSVAILLLAGSASGASVLVPNIIDSYVTPGDVPLTGGDFDSAGLLHLSVPSNPPSGVDRFTFQPDTGQFTAATGFIAGSLPEGDWALDLSGDLVQYACVYTGWADFCPDGSFHAVGWGGSEITAGATSLDYDRELWGVTVRPDGEIIVIAGHVMNPCLTSPPTLELVRLTEGALSHAEGTLVAPMQGTIATSLGMSHSTLDYDADNDLYWTLEHDSGTGYWFAAFDSTGVNRFLVPAPGYEARLIHHEDNRFFLIDGSSTLTLWELELDTSVQEWMVVGE